MGNRFSLDDKLRGNCCHSRYNSQNRHFCSALSRLDEMCGTKYCPFYKPSGCEKWIRVETGDSVWMWPPEERREYWKHREVFGHDTIKI